MRSSEWFVGGDEVALSHRVVMRSVGLEVSADNTKPIIGIADSSSDLNPCNLPLRELVEYVKDGVTTAGGLPVVFPVMSLGEDLMKPSAMLYRNLLSMEIEEYLRSYPLDGIVLLANCDKSVPGALMGAFSANLPAIMVVAGARPPAIFRGKRVGTGTDLWRKWEAFRSGEIDKSEWEEFEKCLNCGLGSCNTMGTASSVALMVEALGFALPGTSSAPSNSPARKEAAINSGREIVAMVKSNRTPSSIVTHASFRNALRTLHAIGGSTNAIVHLLALSGRIDGGLTSDSVTQLGKNVPVLANIEPSGALLIQDFHEAGSLPALMSAIPEVFELDALTVTGKSWKEVIPQEFKESEAIKGPQNALRNGGAFAMLKGSLAPDGALLKTSAASKHLFKHCGPAVVFTGYEDMRARIDDPDLEVTENSILVLRGCGAVGVPGMPEWGMIPIPAKLGKAGIKDMVRITDARMSGTSFGTCILHVSPEAAVGGPLAFVEDGDLIEIDVAACTIEHKISENERSIRREKWRPIPSEHLRGWPMLYQQHVTQPDLGCDFDFLRAPTPELRSFVPPVVGRS